MADGVINNKDHSPPRQPGEQRIEQLSSHKSNQKREHIHGRLGTVSLDFGSVKSTSSHNVFLFVQHKLV